MGPVTKDSPLPTGRRERILVVRADRIGDLILTLPCFRSLRENFPQSKIAALTAPHGKEIVGLEETIDEVIVYERDGRHKGIKGILRLAREIRERGFDSIIFIQPEGKLALAGFLAGTRERVGTLYRPYSILFNRRHAGHKSPSIKHESEYSLDLLREIGITPKLTLPFMRLSEKEIESAKALKKEIGLEDSSRPVVVHPGSGGSSRVWSLRKFGEFSELMIKDGLDVVVSGSRAETKLFDEMASGMSRRPVSIVGKTTLRTLAAFYSLSRLIVSNSTGPAHIAASVGTPTVTIFSPIVSSSPVRWRPLGDGHKVFLPDVPPCKKCTKEKCPYFDCMERIEVETLFREVKELKNSS